MASNVKKFIINNRIILRKYMYGLSKANFSSIKTSKSTSSYCLDIVKKSDYENYLCALLLPAESRNSVLALRALNVETMLIRDQVSERNTGFMRLQFWRDTIEGIYQGHIRASPVAFAVAKAIKRHSLSKQWFKRLLDGREENLQDRAFTSLQHVEDYSENTNSSINYLTLESLGIKNLQADHAMSHLGKAQGLITLIRGVTINASQGRVYLPSDLMINYNVSQEDVIRGCKEQKMKDLIFEIASRANTHLETARSFHKEIPQEAKAALLPSVCSDSYLKTIQKADFDIFSGSAQKRDSLLAFKIWMHSLRKKY